MTLRPSIEDALAPLPQLLALGEAALEADLRELLQPGELPDREIFRTHAVFDDVGLCRQATALRKPGDRDAVDLDQEVERRIRVVAARRLGHLSTSFATPALQPSSG